VNEDRRTHAKPFLKWAGSKQALLKHITPVLPEAFNTYYEPFVGAGSVLLHLRPQSAVISDLSSELIGVWLAVQRHAEHIVDRLRGRTPERAEYYRIRSARSSDPVERAVEFIYLNKSCWNGLYRVNLKGQFNVPFGANVGSQIIDAKNILNCSEILNSGCIEIKCCDFADATASAKKGDFVFFDPPYVTRHNFNGFRDYNEKLFSWSDQERLAKEARRLRELGVHVVVTNAAHDDIRALYAGFHSREFDRTSTLASKASFRGRVSEVIFYG
jgi:DNA adenine methylase